MPDIGGYRYSDVECGCAHEYLLPEVSKILSSAGKKRLPQRIFELGCGSGAVANVLHSKGFEIVGVDPSSEGIALANRQFPHLQLRPGSSEDSLATIYGQFPVVLSLEVVEHVFAPRQFAQAVFDLLEPSGMAVISTPYHGYLKNLSLALMGKLDSHFTALWDGGHIKFWSMNTLRTLLQSTGFRNISFHRVGRIPVLAKSMIAVAHKPG